MFQVIEAKDITRNETIEPVTATGVVVDHNPMDDNTTTKHGVIIDGLSSTLSLFSSKNDGEKYVKNTSTAATSSTTIAKLATTETTSKAASPTTNTTTFQQEDERISSIAIQRHPEERFAENHVSNEKEYNKNFQSPFMSGTEQSSEDPLYYTGSSLSTNSQKISSKSAVKSAAISYAVNSQTEMSSKGALQSSFEQNNNNTVQKVLLGQIKIEYSYDGHVEMNNNRINIYTTERINHKTIRISEPWYDSEKKCMERYLRFGRNLTIRCPAQIHFKLLTPRKIKFFLKNEDVIVVINEINDSTLTRL